MRPQVGEHCVKDTKEEDHHIWFDCFLHIHYYFPIIFHNVVLFAVDRITSDAYRNLILQNADFRLLTQMMRRSGAT